MGTLVKFPTAKLLKEKGYNEQCGMLFNENGVPSGTKMSMGGNPNNYINKYSAPTIDDVKWWLYRKHGIWITVETLGNENDYPKFDYKAVTLKDSNSDVDWLMKRLDISYEELIAKSYNNPIEAYEAAIEYVLNNLI